MKPNITSLGYGLFLAINAAGVWGGVFPFLPMEFQTTEIVFWFFLAQSLVFSFSYFASALGSYFFPGPTRTFIVRLATMPYLLGWCCLIAAIYLDAWALPLVVSGGALLGLGSAGFYMLWQRLFASQDSDTGNRDLIKGTLYAAVLYFSLYLIPQAVTAFLIPLVFLPLFGLTIVLKSREIDLDQAMFQDVPRDHPLVYQRLVNDYWRSALCVGALGFCTGIMRSLAIGEPAVGSLVNVLSMGGSLTAAISLLVLWQFKNLSVNVVGAYRVFFPFVITSFLLLPFLPEEYARWLAGGLYAVYSVAIMLMMIQCAQASRDRGINPVFIYGFFGGIVYALHDVGFIGGTFAEQTMIIGIAPLAVVALVAVYLLGLMYFIGQGGFRRIFKHDSDAAASIELVALRAHAPEKKPAGANAEGEKPDDAVPKKAGKRGDRPPREPQAAARTQARGARVPRPHLEAGGAVAAALPSERARDGGHGAHRARQHRGAHRRGSRGHREHHPHALEAHLREAGHPQEAGAARPHRVLRPQRLAGIETLQCAEARFETLCLRSRATPIVVHRFSLRSTAVFV